MTINIEEHFIKLKNVQESVLDYIENDDTEIGFEFIEKVLQDNQIKENVVELKATLHLLVKISNNHHRIPTFFTKIEKILKYLQSSILQNFPNYEIFNIFQRNKRLLLFLFKEKILIPDISIASSILSEKKIEKNYPIYFFPEFEAQFKKLKNRDNFDFNKIRKIYENANDTFEEKRMKGENDDYICTLIQNDSIEDFVRYVNQTNLYLNTTIKPSIYETNNLLNKSIQPTLIQYSAFFGSIQIFKYLYMNKVNINHSIWTYVIHSQNPDLIHFVEEQNIKPFDSSYEKVFIESIKCHHNAISEYFKNNFMSEKNQIFNDFKSFSKYYNFSFFPNEINYDFSTFYESCKNDYISIVELFLNITKLDINSVDIEILFF